jgi:hypothetical protein
MPPHWEPEDVGALQALSRGEAAPHQQIRALKWIIRDLCEYHGLGWHPSGPHEAAFAAGRRFPAVQIEKYLSINLNALRRKDSEQP